MTYRFQVYRLKIILVCNESNHAGKAIQKRRASDLKGDRIILQPHSLSPVLVRVLRHPEDAEFIGQVIGMAVSRAACG